jgi:hypothetical protein
MQMEQKKYPLVLLVYFLDMISLSSPTWQLEPVNPDVSSFAVKTREYFEISNPKVKGCKVLAL